METIDFFAAATGIKRGINGSSSTITVTNANGSLAENAGLALRGAMLSREYLLERYGAGSPSYSLPLIRINFDLDDFNPKNDEGQFDSQSSPLAISLQTIGLNFTTVAHEYGHYVNYRMWNTGGIRFKNPSSAERGLFEGWAQFYSFAVRNWANNTYDEPLEESTKNMEKDPFKPTPYAGNPYRTTFPDAPRAASYMWNVYDGPNLGEFQATIYSNADNDDFGGDPLRVFTIMENINETEQTFADFHNDYISGLTINQQNSVIDIKDFTDNPSSDKMRPIATKNLATQENSGSIAFSWDNQSYTGTDDYRNDGGAYHELYIDNEDGLQSLSSQISYNGTSYTYNHGSSVASGAYQIRTFNSAGQALSYTTTFLGASTPTGLEVTNESATFGGPRLDWDDNPEAVDHYIVYRYRSNPPYGQPNTQQIGTTTSSQFTDITVAIAGDSETFQYHVVAKKGVFISDKSNAVYIEGDDASPFKIIADQEEKEVLPTVYAMEQNYPNPFNPTTVMSYDLPETAEVTLEVYNILGRRVQTLVNTRQVAGSHQISFDASRLSNGVYIARFKAIGQSGNVFLQERKMTLIK